LIGYANVSIATACQWVAEVVTRPPHSGTDFLQLRPEDAPAKGLTDWLVNALRSAIDDGRLGEGALLPPTRALADDLDVSRGVAVEAYHRLTEEGLVTARTRHGTVVTAFRSPRNGKPGRQRHKPTGFMPRLPGVEDLAIDIDMSPGTPDLSVFPRAAWLRAERTVFNQMGATGLTYNDPRGAIEFRSELAGWLGRTRGVRANPDDILIVGGVAQAVTLLGQVLRGRGVSRIAVEDPGSRGARDGLLFNEMAPVPVPVDADGLRTKALAASGERAVLVTPAHQFPTGVVLAPARRAALLEWGRAGGLIIEDDYDAEYRYDRAPVPALQGSAAEIVAYTGSISKTIAPGIRIGWLIAPPSLHDDLVLAKYANDLGSSILPQLVLAHLLAQGEIDRHLRITRKRYRQRRDAFVQELHRAWPEARVHGVAAGLHVTIEVPERGHSVDDVELSTRIAEAGVLTHPLSWHRSRPGPPGLVAGYAANSGDRLRDAAQRIAHVAKGSTTASVPYLRP
jgi:GntR family transcriptional regulator / MocR family aminotransferase